MKGKINSNVVHWSVEVIENGNKPLVTTVIEGVETIVSPSIAKEKAQRRLELKAISTLLIGIPNEHQLKFNSIKDAKSLLQAIEKRFGRNAATKKTQRNLLKQQYENFITSSSEKFLRSLSPKWNTHTIVRRNKPEIDTLSLDDLYNNVKVYAPEVKRVSSSRTNTQNMAFVSSLSNNNTNSSNEAVNTAFGVTTAGTQVNTAIINNLSDVVICAFLASQPSSRQLVNKDLEQIHQDDLEEMDLKWQMAMLTMRARRFLNNTRMKLNLNRNETVAFNKTKVIANKRKAGLGYNVVPPPYTGNFLLLKPNLSGLQEFKNEHIVSETTIKKPAVETSEAKASTKKPKDETNGILNSSIIRIENLVNHKLKVIRCDNGTKFKNRDMNQFYKMKGIIRQYIIARTPQQNGVAERRNRTLIKAAKTMLANSKLPTTFWAEAVNTACYMQNRLLVTKPYNKTPYELFHGRTLMLSFMRPFGCLVTILNTIDHLGKFDGKADEGFFVRYSLNSKELRVFNSRTRIVEETLHIRAKEVLKMLDLNLLMMLERRLMKFQDKKINTKTKRIKDRVNSTNRVNDVSLTIIAASNEVNVVGRKSSIELPDDPNMPELKDISIFEDSNEDVFGAETDLNNLESTFQVNPIPITRIHKDHPFQQVIKDLHLAPQTRRMLKNLESAFLYRKIEEEVYVGQTFGFKDLDFPDKVYKVEKALYGLHQAPRK
uniref:Retrovirus-related Pol polyprotein from transposon TNT 1-94 n=1 Tax=Tanacetum cinerariifolium TaxID=118510 RepID=A0A6L2MS93_TANCI|nr:retrovirus-related Pol polyprotein from transposon TNT 1-94 [Tanacetum cinerariifolium]